MELKVVGAGRQRKYSQHITISSISLEQSCTIAENFNWSQLKVLEQSHNMQELPTQNLNSIESFEMGLHLIDHSIR